MGHLERHDHVPDVPRCRRVQPRYRCMGYLERHEHERCSMPAFNRYRMGYSRHDMARSTSHAFNQHLSRWDVSSVTTMRQCSTTPTHSTRCRRAGTHPKSRISYNILFCRRMVCQVHGRRTDTLPGRGWTRKDNACDASYPPVNGAVGNCTDTLVSGTSCVPDVRRRVRAEGRDVVHRPGTDRRLCVPWTSPPGPSSRRRWTRASAIGCARAPCPTGTCSRVTDMSFLFQGKTQFNVDISQWEMSQVEAGAGAACDMASGRCRR